MTNSTGGCGRLEGKIALVTGSTSGIGAGIAEEFAREGASVLISGRNEEAGNRVIQQIVSAGGQADRLAFHAADLTDVDECRGLVGGAREAFGGLDILVNNAGDFTRGTIQNTTVELWDFQMALNLRAPFLLTQAAVPLMQERGGGAIVNIGSVNAYIGGRNLTSYSVTKGGLMTFTKNVAAQLSREHIRVNQINVGWTLTEGERRVQTKETGREDWLEAALPSRPFGRLLSPRDIALAAVYLASDESALVTGSVLDLEQGPVGGS
ncbi:MAG: oxidoreductase [Chloroflexota bacterium]|nr:oxidoreductase [Chloroflexota bacterium]